MIKNKFVNMSIYPQPGTFQETWSNLINFANEIPDLHWFFLLSYMEKMTCVGSYLSSVPFSFIAALDPLEGQISSKLFSFVWTTILVVIRWVNSPASFGNLDLNI